MSKLASLAAVALAALAALTAPYTATANVATSAEITVKRVVIRFLAKNELKSVCGKRARACAYSHANIVILPEDEAYGWTGTRTARLQVQWHTRSSLKSLDCGSRYACLQGGVVHARNVGFHDRGIVWLGEAYAAAIGLEYNPRRVELLAHELKHVLTGERHEHG